MSYRDNGYEVPWVICSYCNGAGEGMVDGSVFQNCKGTGEIKGEDDNEY